MAGPGDRSQAVEVRKWPISDYRSGRLAVWSFRKSPHDPEDPFGHWKVHSPQL